MLTTMPKQHHQGMMMGPMKGHLAPNSSPFKPTINKLSSQYLIQDHMSNHYMKLGTAKPAIDNKPPKSMATSVKKRDQMKREAMAKQMKLFDLEKEMKHSGASSYRQQTPDSSLYGSQRLFTVTVTKNGYDEPRPQSVSSYRSGRMSPRPRSLSSPRAVSGSNPNSPRDKPRRQDILNETYSGDYLDRHEHKFKNVDTPFTPRLKKRSGAKSRLADSKHYAPPLMVSKETKRKTAHKSPRKEDEQSPTSSASDIHARERSRSRESRESKSFEDRIDSMSRLSLEDSKQTYDNIYPERSLYDTYGFRRYSPNDTFFGTSSLGRSFSRNETFSNDLKNKIEAEEEEMKYLEFINSVTNDILTRGIYSDRVLTQVMQRHLDQNRGRLNEGRMRHMLMKLQEDLGVSADFTMRGFETVPKYASSYDGSSVSGYGRRSGRRREADHSSSQSRQKSHEKLSAKKHERSDGATSDGSGTSKKGILKAPGTSSGSDFEAKSIGLSSGEEDGVTKPKKVTIKNGLNEKTNTVIEELKDELKKRDEESTTKRIENEPTNTPPTPKKRTSVASEAPSIEVKSADDMQKDKVYMAKDISEDSANSDLDDF